MPSMHACSAQIGSHSATYTMSNLDLVTQSLTLIAGKRSSPLSAIWMRRWTPVVVSSETPIMRSTMRVKRVLSFLIEPAMVARTHLNSALSVDAGSGSEPSLANCFSNLTPSWRSRVASPPSSTIWSMPSPSGQVSALSVHHQYSSSVSPFHAKTLAVPARTTAAAAWSWVEKMLHETQRTSAPSAWSVSMSTAVWMVMWSEPMMRTPASGCAEPNSRRADMRPGISNSARSSSLRPKSASDMSATLKSPDASTALVGGQKSSSLSMPGSTLPSRSSSEAPPPVETKVTLSSMSNLAAAVAESPPPMMPLLPLAVVSATASSTALVPCEKLSNSKTPAGPFQMTVLEARIFSRKRAIDAGPQSMPSQPSGMPSLSVTILVGWSLQKSWPHFQSHGRTISQPLALALAISFGTSSAPFLSKSEMPMGMLCTTFMNV